jgi:hypothetical protein
MLSAALALAAPNVNPSATPVPGTVNYIEGQVSLNGQALQGQPTGSTTGSPAGSVVQPGQTLTTTNGKVEVLLTPGVFLRLGDNSQARMLTNGLADVEVALDRGQATVEADYWPKETRLKIEQGTAVTDILKHGFYVLNAQSPFVQVYKGKASVALSERTVSAGDGHEVAEMASGQLKSQDFSKNAVDQTELVRWSRLRSQYEAQANLETARTVVINNGWYGPGWYWDPYWASWSFLPPYGVVYNPFGFGFYSPVYFGFYGGPRYYGPRFYGGGFPRGAAVVHGGFATRGPVVGGGFRGGGGRR